MHHDLDWVIAPELAERYNPATFKRIEPYFPSGITGQSYFHQSWRADLKPPKVVRLSPMPDNEYDSCAIRVMHGSAQIGWVRSEIAYRLAPYIHILKCLGSQCLVPLTDPKMERLWDPVKDEPYTSVQIGVMVLPTSDYVYSVIDIRRLYRDFDKVWERFTTQEQLQVVKAEYRLSDGLARRFEDLGLNLTEYPFNLPANEDRLIDDYFLWYRRPIQTLSSKREMATRNLNIVAAANEGLSHQQIADRVGCTASIVRRIKKEGKDPGILNSWRTLLRSIPSDHEGLSEMVVAEHF